MSTVVVALNVVMAVSSTAISEIALTSFKLSAFPKADQRHMEKRTAVITDMQQTTLNIYKKNYETGHAQERV